MDRDVVPPELEKKDFRQDRWKIFGYFVPFMNAQPVVITLPGLVGEYVPIFKKREDMVDALRYLKVWKYETVLVGDSNKFYESIQRGNAMVVVNPRAYNGVTIWDEILPNEYKIILPPES